MLRRPRNRSSVFVLFFTLLFALICEAHAQTNTSAISGSVKDASGAVMPGVTISVANAASGKMDTTQSKSAGEFSFEQLQPGTYMVRVSQAGFSEQVQKVELLVSTPVKLNFTLTAGTSEIVNVATSLADLNSTDATLGKAFNSQQVATLPYLANNITYLLSLQPGVLALDSGAQSGGLNADTRTGIVNGARQDQTNLTLDGVDNNDQIFGYAFNGALRSTRESVEEFRVTTTNANADAGRSSGAQVSLVTRSGTNALHGTAYEYYRDPGTTSNNWFNKQAQLNSGLPNIAAKVLEHTYGASLGLPLLKNRLFFFGAYEGFKQASDVLVSETVPSVLTANGGHAGLITGNVVYQACPTSATCQTGTQLKTLTPTDIASLDGRSGDPNCTAATPCAAPATNQAALAYFKQFPLANSNVTGDGYNTGTFNFTSPAPLHQITNIARLDFNLNSKQTIFVRGNLQSDNQATPLQSPGLPAASNVFGNNKGIAAGHIWTINDHLTNNFRYGFTRVGSASIGTGSLPHINFSAFSNLLATSTTSIYRVSTHDFEDELTYSKGRHTIQAGVSIYRISNGQYFDAPTVASASINPNLIATAAIANQGGYQGGTLDPAQFNCPDCGTVASSFQNFYNAAIVANTGIIEEAQSGNEFQVKGNTLNPIAAVPFYTYRNLEQEYFVQDQWKATERLTFTAGLRYVHLGVPYEVNGQQIAPSISLNTFLARRAAAAAAGTAYTTDVSFRPAGSPNGQPNFWTPQNLNFAPRFAFAYATQDNKTTLRGGFAISYDHFGQGIINGYQQAASSLFGLAQTNISYLTGDINSNPRFDSYFDVPSVAGAAGPLQLPYTPGEQPFSFDSSINDSQKTPYAETFNLTFEHQLPKSLDITISYVGRLGRHLLQSLDVAQPVNFTDTVSGQNYYQAAAAFAKMVDAGVSPASVPNSGYFRNVFPNFAHDGYKGAQAYYASLSENRGNETNTLFQADTDPTASAGGQSFRFFFPQTSSIYAQSTIGTSNYHALQISARQVLKYGLEYDINYTYSKSLDEGSDPERVQIGSPIINTFGQSQMYAVSDFDVRHNLTANYSAPLPFGHGTPYLNGSNLLDRLFGGFQLNGVVHFSTGFPFSAVAANTYGTNFAFSSFEVQTGPIPTGGHHYDPVNQVETALKGITSAQATANLRFAYPGETGQRNNFRADGYFSLDDGFAKSIHLPREQQLRLSAEVFNILNTNRFNSQVNGTQSPLQTDGTSANFGVYTGGPNALLLQPRQMQFSGKYIF